MTLINKSAIRQFTLDALKQERPHLAAKKTRIADSYFERIEARLRAAIIHQEIQTMPTTGATIK
jgi:hypothetical protein